MQNTQASLRSFVFNNILILEELRRIEQETGLEIIDTEKQRDPVESQYYKRFDDAARIEAKEMSKHYEVFYCLERSMRQLIKIQMDTAFPGGKWWAIPQIPQIVVDEVTKRTRKEEESGITQRSDDPLDYTTFGELGEIIKSNWVTFGSIFNNLKAVEKVINSLNTLRNNIAHCCPLAEDEKVRLTLTIRDWFRLMD